MLQILRHIRITWKIEICRTHPQRFSFWRCIFQVPAFLNKVPGVSDSVGSRAHGGWAEGCVIQGFTQCRVIYGSQFNAKLPGDPSSFVGTETYTVWPPAFKKTNKKELTFVNFAKAYNHVNRSPGLLPGPGRGPLDMRVSGHKLPSFTIHFRVLPWQSILVIVRVLHN